MNLNVDNVNYDIDFDALMEEEAVTTIELPANFIVKFLPETLTHKTKWSDIINDYNLKDNKIVLTSRNTQKKKAVSREEYSEFRKSLQDLAEKSKQCIILEKIKDGPEK